MKGRPNIIEDEAWNPEKSLIEQLPLALDIWSELTPKYHTIRNGNRWKEGDKFSPRVWSGKPYNSPQIILAPDTLIVKTWNFEVTEMGYFYLNGRRLWTDFNTPIIQNIFEIAKNDGLEPNDLLAWFKYPKAFKGQIICWNNIVNY